jgi:hypothetical protein
LGSAQSFPFFFLPFIQVEAKKSGTSAKQKQGQKEKQKDKKSREKTTNVRESKIIRINIFKKFS